MGVCVAFRCFLLSAASLRVYIYGRCISSVATTALVTRQGWGAYRDSLAARVHEANASTPMLFCCGKVRDSVCGSSGVPLSTRECRCRRRTPSWISRSRNGRGKSCRRSWATTSTLSTRREVCLCVFASLFVCLFACRSSAMGADTARPCLLGRVPRVLCVCAHSASAAIVLSRSAVL